MKFVGHRHSDYKSPLLFFLFPPHFFVWNWKTSQCRSSSIGCLGSSPNGLSLQLLVMSPFPILGRGERCWSFLLCSLATVFHNHIGFANCFIPRCQLFVCSCQFPHPPHKHTASFSYPEGCLVTVVYFLLNFLIGFHCSIFCVFWLPYFTATFRFPESWYREQATKVTTESQVVPVLSLKEFIPIGPSRDRPKN